jgi:hypothetical protein
MLRRVVTLGDRELCRMLSVDASAVKFSRFGNPASVLRCGARLHAEPHRRLPPVAFLRCRRCCWRRLLLLVAVCVAHSRDRES